MPSEMDVAAKCCKHAKKLIEWSKVELCLFEASHIINLVFKIVAINVFTHIGIYGGDVW
jgi:hypothetical protein